MRIAEGHMSNLSYAIIVWCYVSLLAIFAGARNPYGVDFFPVVVPALLLLVSLQWLLLSSRFGWQTAAICSASAGAVMILLSRSSLARENTTNYILILLLPMLAQLVPLWFLAPDNSARSIILAENLSVALMILLGTRLTSYGGDLNFSSPRTGRFLFWSPLAALSLWVSGANFGWRKSSRVIFICLIAQNSIGFFDMGVRLQAAWMYACAAGCILAAFAFLIGWAGELNK
jgi:hypothetical protein